MADEVKVATPNPDMNIESVMSFCLNCRMPVVTVKMDAGAAWSDWSHAQTAQVECQMGVPEPPPATQREN